jgi:hypothetical protein
MGVCSADGGRSEKERTERGIMATWRRFRDPGSVLFASCAALCVACGSSSTAPGDDGGLVDGAAGTTTRGGVGLVRIYDDAVLGDFSADVTIFHPPDAPNCVVHLGAIEDERARAGTLKVGSIVPSVDTGNNEYVYFGSVFANDSSTLAVSLTGAPGFPAMPDQAVRPPPAATVVITAPDPGPPPPNSIFPVVALSQSSPFEIAWDVPASPRADHRIFVGSVFSKNFAQPPRTSAGIYCSFPIAAGHGAIPVSALSYAAQEVGLPAAGGLHLGSGDWKAVAGSDYSYVIEITRPQSGTSLSSYEMGATLE